MTRKITPPPGMDFPSQTFPRKQASILSGPQSHSGDKPITNLLLSGLSQKWDWGHEGVGQVWHTFFTFFLLEVYDMLLQLFTMCVKHVVPVHTYVPEVLLCTSHQAKYQVLVSTVVFVIYLVYIFRQQCMYSHIYQCLLYVPVGPGSSLRRSSLAE